ncbi:MAG TPA: glycosyltransferase family 4 protein [Chthoniobacterales bacterium]|nr:glycosyltransferase family 4 protein [Chthoniobacterales bacterium]
MSEKRRLLIVSHEMTLSGAPIQLAHLVAWLNGHGWEPVVVAPERGPLAAKLSGIEIIYESQLLIDPAYGALRRLAPQFDCVLANTIATWEAVQACQFERVPVVWYIHETQVGVQLMQIIHMIEPSLGVADAVVTPTQTTARVYAPFRHKPIDVIPYGIPPAAAGAARLGLKVRIAVVATYEARKGQDLLLDAVEKLGDETRARTSFQLAGRPLEEAFTACLRARADQLGNVELLGPVEHEQALQTMREADIVVCPSRDETMPIILLEAMSMGKATISFDAGGIHEWIADGTNGFLVPAQDTRGLAAAIERVVADSALRQRVGSAARQTYEQHFTTERCGEEFARVIRRTVANYNATSP